MILPNAIILADLGTMVVDLLAVIGGAAAGGLGAGWGGQRVSRATIRRSLPPRIVTGLRLGGGLLSGLLVWFFVFGTGSGGLGSGGLSLGNFSGDPRTDPAPTSARETVPAPLPTPPATPAERPPTSTTIRPRPTGLPQVARIELLGESRVGPEQRFYKLDGGSPQTLAEVVDILRTQQQEGPGIDRVEIVLYLNSVTEQDPAVTRLKRRLRDDLKLSMETRVIDREAP